MIVAAFTDILLALGMGGFIGACGGAGAVYALYRIFGFTVVPPKRDDDF